MVEEHHKVAEENKKCNLSENFRHTRKYRFKKNITKLNNNLLFSY